MTTTSTAEKIAALIQGERWAAQAAQHEFDRRIVEYALKNGIDPLRAMAGRVHVIGRAALDECAKGLDL